VKWELQGNLVTSEKMVQRANLVHKDQEANLGQVETKARRESKDQLGSQETKV
jgi:hypothetical protein